MKIFGVGAKDQDHAIYTVRQIILLFARLPFHHGLIQRHGFDTLLRIVDDATINDNLLRSIYIEFFSEDRIDLQLRFAINWQTGAAIVESGLMSPELVPLNGETAGTNGLDLLQTFSPKLFELYNYIENLVAEGRYDEATWTIELGDGGQDISMAKRSAAVEAKYGLIELPEDHLRLREELEKANPINARFRKQTFKQLYS